MRPGRAMIRTAGSAGRRHRAGRAAVRTLALALAVPICASPVPAAARARATGAAECLTGPTRSEVLAGIGQRGEIRLASGARAVLDSLR